MNAGFVKEFLVSEVAQDSSVSSGNTNFDPDSQTSHPPVGPCPTPDASSILAVSQSWMDYLNLPEHTNIPGFDRRLSCYPKLPSFGVDDFGLRQQSVLLEPGRHVASQPESMNELISTREDCPAVQIALNSSEHTLKYLLCSSDAKLDDNQAQGVLDASAHPLLATDLDQILRPLFDY
ncbi:uncharacterized protein N7446_005622 [Penicillium canescens]|uniref:Uncharacterized protein n=1 Tax=Penicillium canescens TaxID=5083 RepID=A0AAD6II28_PENCN|nr:uncharacterized protein N7446_005622 [Penicillium canescens]KAJ6050133.1 hypothetical protein N7444_006849 [Penicillium canescens]KAJ6050994.1 hypothetical protein N7460_001528 [Penicillium canescens]KAJ6061502.1 hypothetical protein N7446_005622 [Penicillium canescens]